MTKSTAAAGDKPLNFIEQVISQDIESGKHTNIVTRFPPEPNGYLHIGHAKSICLNFGLAQRFGGVCNLRFDDTNPAKEDQEYIDSIKRDVEWMGFSLSQDDSSEQKQGSQIFFASSYFEQIYQWALELINAGKAYVCALSPDEARTYRGTLTEPGKPSPYRDRSVAENFAEFEKMRAGEYDEGACVLRAKIDMAAGNINLRDPILYRIRKQHHHQTGDRWCIYPTYDFAHGQGDAIEGVTHSICTLEFADHRPLYEWFLANLSVPAQPRQYEFARLELNYTITSKRKLKQLVDENYVDGWDDPRMPTIAGMRRRGYTPAALRQFCDMIGVTKSASTVDVGMLEYAVRDDLNNNAPRAMCVMQPLLLKINNFAEHYGDGISVSQPCHPNRSELGEREIPFTGEVFIEREDFTEDTSLSRKKFKRLVLGEYVRLRGGSVIKAENVVKNDAGEITAVECSLVSDTIGMDPPEGVRPRGVIHWVSASDSLECQVRLYDRLFVDASPDAGGKDFLQCLNPESLSIIDGARAEKSLTQAQVGDSFQFERQGYFTLDSRYSSEQTLVFNRTIGLKDNWASKVKSNGSGSRQAL